VKETDLQDLAGEENQKVDAGNMVMYIGNSDLRIRKRNWLMITEQRRMQRKVI